MPCITWSAISGFIMMIVVPMVLKALFALGVGYVTFTGVNALLTSVMNDLASGAGALPVPVKQILYAFGLDKALSIFCSAISFRLAWMGVSSGSITKFVTRGPAT